jgi:ABC-type Mn2+/Zn2+ transport system ATPase subunit
VEELSGGEQQRVWLAFGLAPAKNFLILDETLEGMDIVIKRSFFQLLKEIATEDKGILLASHDLTLVTEFADKVIVLSDGKVSYEGLPQENLQYFLSPSGKKNG